jgi:hypothetical protein
MPQAGGVAVVIPTFNEAESIGAVVAELPAPTSLRSAAAMAWPA